MDDDELGHYQHTPLSEPDGVRIIVLRPSATLTSPVSCDLIHSTLHHYDDSITSHYTAISYVWGSATDTRTILMNSKPLSITATLDSALRRIRDPKQEIHVWADGICINQHDVNDKNHQVRMMGLIYEIARHTVIYLGESTAQTDGLFEELRTHISTSGDSTRSGYLANVRHSSKNAYFGDRTSEDDSGGLRCLQGLARNHVLTRPWFTRVWVLQELVLSGDPWIQIGSHRLRWIVFTELMVSGRVPNRHEDLVQKRLLDMQALRNNLIAPALSGTREECRYLLQILHSRRGYGVFDARDMLYAHLGMLERDERNKDAAPPNIDALLTRGKEKPDTLIQIDYNKSVPEVYTDLALYLLRCQRGFGVLSHIEDATPEERDPRLPSWVPDWTVSQTSADARSHFAEHFEMPCFDSVHIVLDEPKVLGCIGSSVGIIEVVKDDLPTRSETEEIIQKIQDVTFSSNATERVAYSDYGDDESAAGSSNGCDDDDSGPTNEQLVQALGILYEELQGWVGSDFLPVFHDIDDVPDGFIRHVVPHIRSRIRKIMREPDFERLVPEAPYTSWWNYVGCHDDDEKDSGDSGHEEGDLVLSQKERLISQVLLASTDCHSSSFFAGKKLAVLNTRMILLVPRWAKAGDLICRFNDNRSLPYVVRGVKPSEELTRHDEEIVRFFTDKKVAAREKYVEYSTEGEIIWKKDNLDAKKSLNLSILLSFWPEYLEESAELHKQGRKEWSTYRHTHREDNCQLSSELKVKLDELSSKVIRATNIASGAEVLLQQTDTSEVGHFRVVGECIIDERSTFRKSDEDGDESDDQSEDKNKQHIIALH